MIDQLPDVTGSGGRRLEAQPVYVTNGLDGGAALAAVDFLSAATLSGTGYSAGTGTVPIATGQFLKARLSNPLGSGVRLTISLRRFNNDRSGNDPLLERVLALNVADMPGASSRTPNLLDPVPGGAASAALFSFVADTSDISGGNIGTPMPLNGIPQSVTELRRVYPGQSVAYQIEGATGALSDVARASITFAWAEEQWSG